eukprot:1178211-Prorocentrum_minimum.AAC.5
MDVSIDYPTLVRRTSSMSEFLDQFRRISRGSMEKDKSPHKSPRKSRSSRTAANEPARLDTDVQNQVNPESKGIKVSQLVTALYRSALDPSLPHEA